MSDYRSATVEAIVAAEQRALTRPLHRPRAALFALTATRVSGAWDRPIPARFWTEDTEACEVVVACPCGTEVRIADAMVPESCTSCERWYLFDGTNVRVALSPVAE